MKFFKYCIEHGSIVDIWDKDNNYPLLQAVINKSKEMVEILLDLGANPNHKCNWDFIGDFGMDFPITAAARANDIDIFKMLIEHGASLYPETGTIYQLPIYFAVIHGNKEMVNLILEHDDDQHVKDYQSLIVTAIKNDHIDMAELLIENGVIVDEQLIKFAIKQGSFKTVEYLYNKLDDKSLFCKLLPNAANNGNSKIFKFILSIDGVNVNEKCWFGNTALICVSLNNSKSLVKRLLLKDDVDVNAKNKNNETALMCATKLGHRKIVELLLDVDGIDVNVRNKHGNTALMLALSKGHIGVARFILRHSDDLDITAVNDQGETALTLASRNGNRKVLKLLLKADGIDLNVRDRDGNTPLMIAAFHGNSEVVDFLLSKGKFDVNERGFNGDTALMRASLKGHAKTVRHLLATDGIDVNAKNNDNQTALDFAKNNGYKDISKILRKSGGISSKSSV